MIGDDEDLLDGDEAVFALSSTFPSTSHDGC